MSQLDRRRQVPETRLWYRILEPFIARFETLGVFGKTVVWVLVVFLIGLVPDLFLHSAFSWPWMHERLLEHAIESVMIGIFVFTLIDAKEKRIQRRFKELGYLNHHIRNALTIIEMAESNVTEAQERLDMIKDASSRIRRCVEKISRQEDTKINEKEPQKP
jgi:hypothetical protein